MRYAQKAVKHLEGESYSTYSDLPKDYFKCYLCGKKPDQFNWTTPMWPDKPLSENKFFHVECQEKHNADHLAEIMRRNLDERNR